jgi:hypothetical protein
LSIHFLAVGTVARSNLLREQFSGQADDRLLALTEPRSLISQPLFMPRGDEPDLQLERWEFPDQNSQHPEAAAFQNLLRLRKAFVVGGCQFIVEMGLVADYYRAIDVRQETLALLRDRGLLPLLEELAGNENANKNGGADALFGQNALSAYISTLPRLKRDRPETKKWKPLNNRELYRSHLLRLRKAIEFITLTEVIVRKRLRAGKSQKRFSDFTGLSGKDEENALFVWDHFWIEPVIFSIDPLPRRRDIRSMVKNERVAQLFESKLGLLRGALPWVLLGVPSKFATARAAADACNLYYGDDAEKTEVVTIRPSEFRKGLNLLHTEHDFRDFVKDIERIWSLGPPQNK